MKTQYIRLPHLIAELHAEWKNARQAYAKAEIPARAANRPKGSRNKGPRPRANRRAMWTVLLNLRALGFWDIPKKVDRDKAVAGAIESACKKYQDAKQHTVETYVLVRLSKLRRYSVKNKK